jgi:hypothetical protein
LFLSALAVTGGDADDRPAQVPVRGGRGLRAKRAGVGGECAPHRATRLLHAAVPRRHRHVRAVPGPQRGRRGDQHAPARHVRIGRFELGLGAGRPDAERDAARLGVPFGSPGERIRRIEQTLQAVHTRLARSDEASRYDAVRGVQQPRPAVLVAGDRFGRLELNLNIALVGDDYPPQAAAWLGADPQDLIRNGSITVLAGSARQMADTLLRRRDRAAVSYVSVNAQFADRFAPVIELLADA